MFIKDMNSSTVYLEIDYLIKLVNYYSGDESTFSNLFHEQLVLKTFKLLDINYNGRYRVDDVIITLINQSVLEKELQNLKENNESFYKILKYELYNQYEYKTLRKKLKPHLNNFINVV